MCMRSEPLMFLILRRCLIWILSLFWLQRKGVRGVGEVSNLRLTHTKKKKTAEELCLCVLKITLFDRENSQL